MVSISIRDQYYRKKSYVIEERGGLKFNSQAQTNFYSHQLSQQKQKNTVICQFRVSVQTKFSAECDEASVKALEEISQANS